MDISIDTGELDRLAGELAQTGKVERDVDRAVKVTATELQSRAQAAAPVATGALRDSITLVGEGDEWVVGTDLNYARYVEWGTSDTAPQPFMFNNVGHAESELADAVERVANPFI